MSDAPERKARFWSWMALIGVVLLVAYVYYRIAHPHVIINPYVTR